MNHTHWRRPRRRLMNHTHWDPALVERLFINAPPAPICPFRTKKECDENWTQFQHGHLGHPCIKAFQPSKSKRGKVNTIMTCTIVEKTEHGESFRQRLARQLAAAPASYNDRQARAGEQQTGG